MSDPSTALIMFNHFLLNITTSVKEDFPESISTERAPQWPPDLLWTVMEPKSRACWWQIWLVCSGSSSSTSKPRTDPNTVTRLTSPQALTCWRALHDGEALTISEPHNIERMENYSLLSVSPFLWRIEVWLVVITWGHRSLLIFWFLRPSTNSWDTVYSHPTKNVATCPNRR